MDPVKLALMIDQTLLKPNARKEDFESFCADSLRYHFKAVAVNPCVIRLCRQLLSGSDVLVAATVGFPLGQSSIETKVFEARDAVEKGADEIDYVINIGEVKNRNWDYIKSEMEQIVSFCRGQRITSKVIFENCYLSKEEIRILCGIALEKRPDFIKTSTGFGDGGAKIEDVRLMKESVGDNIKIKASGGIRDFPAALAMIQAGAERIGTSSGIRIIKECMAEYK
ncbi:MAG: deoxyribose-phosphate aldolase [Spirochaetales bacterium]|nr:deoxyribose-phosphate aldolase [Spirochaetales bacterium]